MFIVMWFQIFHLLGIFLTHHMKTALAIGGRWAWKCNLFAFACFPLFIQKQILEIYYLGSYWVLPL